MKIFVIAGDISAEQYALQYMQSIPNGPHQFKGIGGQLLQENGLEIIQENTHLSVIGIVEIIKKFSFFKSVLKKTQEEITTWQPDLILMIDFPGFNLALLKRIAHHKTPIHYYIPPQLFAWGASRIKLLASGVTQVYYFYDFEREYLTHPQLKATQVAQPKTDAIQPQTSSFPIKRIALLPGSRQSELTQLIPIFESIRSTLSAQGITLTYYLNQTHAQQVATRLGVNPLYIQATPIQDIKADLALCCSGTVTLEVALRAIPMLVLYRTSWLNYFFLRAKVNVPWISLPNLICQQTVVPELIQSDCSAKNILPLIEQFSEQQHREQLQHFQKIRENLSRSERLENHLAQDGAMS